MFNFYDKVMSTAFHQKSNLAAKKILRSLNRTEGPQTLSRNRIKCDEYANEKFGSLVFSPWLQVYSGVNGGFKEGWIPENFYGAVVVPCLKGSYGKLSSLKSITGKIFHNERSFPDVASIINGTYFDPSYKLVSEEELKILLNKNGERFVFKPDSSAQGKGLFFFDRPDIESLNLSSLGDGVFQRYIDQHEFFDRFNSNSVATLRLTTVTLNDGTVEVRGAYLRLGSQMESHVESKSHIRVPVCVVSGELNPLAYKTDWAKISIHPLSNVPFKGATIPEYTSCVDVVKGLHSKVSFVKCIGWDVVIDNEGHVKVMEWNGGHNDIKFSEAVQGPCFADLGWENLPRTHWHPRTGFKPVKLR